MGSNTEDPAEYPWEDDADGTYPWEDGHAVMGILNVSPSSYYEDSVHESLDAVVEEAERMVEQGADVLDVGAEAKNPDAEEIDPDEEIEQLVPVIERLRAVDALVSVDTWKAEVADAVLQAGADVINDVSGLDDPEMAEVVAAHDAPIVVMYSVNPIVDPDVDLQVEYDDVIEDVRRDLEERIAIAEDAGIPPEHIVVDPGIGHSMTIRQSTELIARLEELASMDYPLLVAHSRKLTFEHVGGDPEDCYEATVAFTTAVIERGADVIRVHDVAPNAEAAKVGRAMRSWDPRFDDT